MAFQRPFIGPYSCSIKKQIVNTVGEMDPFVPEFAVTFAEEALFIKSHVCQIKRVPETDP